MLSTVASESPPSVLDAWVYGTLRSLVVQAGVYPLDVVKRRQQAADVSQNVREATQGLAQEGWRAFYRGGGTKLAKMTVSHMVRWTLLSQLPSHLRPYQFGDLREQIITGLLIAKVDAITSKHLDTKQMRAAVHGQRLSISQMLQQGGRGYGVYWAYLSTAWCTSLVGLKYFGRSPGCEGCSAWVRDIEVGVKTGLVVSAATIPFDCLNTVQQATDLCWGAFLRRQGVRALFRGWPIQAVISSIHNTGTQVTFRMLEL